MTKLSKEELSRAEARLRVATDCDCDAVVPRGVLFSLIAAARELESRHLDEQELVQLLTEAMRAADQAFDRVGGSTRHYVRDCLIPELERAGLAVVRQPKGPMRSQHCTCSDATCGYCRGNG